LAFPLLQSVLTRGDLSLLTFELLALGYFMRMKDIIQIDSEIVRLSEEQSSLLLKMGSSQKTENKAR
jgi:hypothetical protein